MNNLHKKFNIEIQKYIEKISNRTTVVGIVLTGSAGRGDFDKYSDIDNVVVVSGENKVKEGKFINGDFLFDTRIVDLNKIKAKWSNDMYFAYLTSNIVYDPGNILKKIFVSKEKDWKRLIVKRISFYLVDLSVIYEFKDNWKCLQSTTHYQKFLKRGDYISAHKILNSGFEIILNMFYLINDTPVPDSKNKIRLLHKLKDVPSDIEMILEEALTVKSFNHSDLERRYKTLDLLVGEIKKNIKNMDKLSENLYNFYLTERN
jgi:predicted nucleotidyltransferase